MGRDRGGGLSLRKKWSLRMGKCIRKWWLLRRVES